MTNLIIFLGEGGHICYLFEEDLFYAVCLFIINTMVFKFNSRKPIQLVSLGSDHILIITCITLIIVKSMVQIQISLNDVYDNSLPSCIEGQRIKLEYYALIFSFHSMFTCVQVEHIFYLLIV